MPRVVFNANSHSGQQDQRDQDARSLWDPPSESRSSTETWKTTPLIPGIPLSVVEQQDTNRQIKVKKLIEKFEKHQHKESFIQDVSQTQKINKFSKESQELIADMNNTEIFELCENSSKKQSPIAKPTGKFALYVGSCGRNAKKSSQRPKEFEKNNRDVSSIPCYVIKKNSSRGAKHGPSERQRMYFQAKQMLKKARQGKHGRHPTILSRWYASESYRHSLNAGGEKNA